MSIEPIGTDRRMTNAEAVMLCRYAKAACPQQQFDEFTPDAWSDLLGDLRFEDCRDALRAVVQRQPFVAPAEIRTEVKRIRNDRILKFGPLPDPPYGDDYSPAAYQAYLRDTLRRIGDGEVVTPADLTAFEPHDVVGELGHIGQEMP